METRTERRTGVGLSRRTLLAGTAAAAGASAISWKVIAEQIETLKKSAGDNTELQNQITALQEANKQKDKDHANEIKALKISNAVDVALTNAKAKNNTAVKALLAAFLEKAELADDGTVKGLDDEIGKLTKGEDTAFLFDTSGKAKFKGAKAAEKSDPHNQPTGDDLSKMSYDELCKYMEENPDAVLE